MKKKIIIFVNIFLVLILFVIGFGYYKVFLEKNNTKPSKKTNSISEVYVCDYYGKKTYLENKNSLQECYKVDFSCEDCTLIEAYVEDKILYKTDDSVVIYDLTNSKQIDSVVVGEDYYEGNLQEYYIETYKQDGKTYGFAYYAENEQKMFYNLNNSKKFELKGRLCESYYEEDDGSDACITNDDLDIIHNDIVIVEVDDPTSPIDWEKHYGALNLKTGKYLIPTNKENIQYKYFSEYKNDKEIKTEYYMMPYGTNDAPDSLYDKNLKPIFEIKDESKYLVIQDYLAKDVILYYYDEYNEYYVLFDENGKEYPNSRIYGKDINKKIYNKIENTELKNKTEKDMILYYMKKDDINFYINNQENVFYIDFYFNDSYYETYIDIHYKYDLNTNTLSEYEYSEDECYECEY